MFHLPLIIIQSEDERDSGGATSPCVVRFVNDNVLINGRSSLSGAARDRHAVSGGPAAVLDASLPALIHSSLVSAEAAV